MGERGIIYNNFWKSLILCLIFEISFFCANKNLVCKSKKIWDVKDKPSKELERKKNILLKAFNSRNERKKYIAYNKFRKIAPYFLKDIKKNFNSFSNLQKYYLRYFLLKNITRITELKIFCRKDNSFMWYIILDNRFLVIGNNSGIVDSALLPFQDREIVSSVCNRRDNLLTRYAIGFSNGLVVTNAGVFRNAKVEYDPNDPFHNNFIMYTPDKIIINGEVEIEKYTGIDNIYISPDGNRAGLIIKKGNQFIVVVDGKEYQKRYDEILNFRFSINSKRFYFIAKRGKKEYIVIDGKESGPYKKIANFRWSINSKRYLYTSLVKDGWIVVVDGIKSRKYRSIGKVDFTKDSKRIYFVALKTRIKKIYGAKVIVQKKVVVVDGVESQEYDELLTDVNFSDDSFDFWFVGRKDDKVYFIFNGKESPGFDSISNINYNNITKSYYYLATIKGKKVFVINGRTEKRYDSIYQPGFTNDGKRYYYYANVGKKWWIVVDGRESKKYEEIVGLEFSPDNKRYAFLGKRKGKWFLFVDGKEIKTDKEILDFSFSCDGKKFMYIIKHKSGWRVVVNGITYYNLSAIDWREYSCGKKKFKYIKKGGKRVLVIGINKKKKSRIPKIKINEKAGEKIRQLFENSFDLISDYFFNGKKILFLGWLSGKLSLLSCPVTR